MAELFLTSSPTGPLDGSRLVDGLDAMNGFPERLRAVWPQDAAMLMITATPDAYAANEGMTAFFAGACRRSGLGYWCFDLWDDRRNLTAEELHAYDVIWLGGGHVPTQHAFFESIGLREKLIGYEGIVIGISAGTMNTADTVYCQPEEPGEAADPSFCRWHHGLALTETMILPHYQMVKHNVLDGLRLFEDVTYADSMGNEFLALTDGAYLHCSGGRETVYGEAYRIADGVCTLLCRTDESVVIRG